jgi:hypothetical protein
MKERDLKRQMLENQKEEIREKERSLKRLQEFNKE